MIYFAKITKQQPAGYVVEFPQLKGCLTEGRTLKEARNNAAHAMNGWLEVACQQGVEIPAPQFKRGKYIYPIQVDIKVGLKILKTTRPKKQRLAAS